MRDPSKVSRDSVVGRTLEYAAEVIIQHLDEHCLCTKLPVDAQDVSKGIDELVARE